MSSPGAEFLFDKADGARILIYSHDTFGLGHLRRCRAIAHGLVERYKQLTVLILSGSPIIGSFDFRARVDFVRIPGVIKLRNGDYTSLGLHIDLEHTLAIRSSIIQHTVRRDVPDLPGNTASPVPAGDYLLVTPGGGGDGDVMVDWVLRAYESAADQIGIPAVIVLGPFMQAETRNAFEKRAEPLDSVQVLTFHSHFELLMADATAVVAMGGYNTFCEILSFDKPALIVPRTVPRMEQFIRASKAVELGLLAMIDADRCADTDAMVTALIDLLQQAPPSAAGVVRLLDGIDVMTDLVGEAIERRRGDNVIVPRTG